MRNVPSPSPARELATTVVFAAFIAVLGIFPGLYVGGSGVPIVVQNIGPLLAGAMLGARRGTAAVALLLALAAIGLPLLSGGRGGIAPFVGPSGGFLLGWLVSALVVGLIAARSARPRLPLLLLAALTGLLVDYLIGIPWLWWYTGSFKTAAYAGVTLNGTEYVLQPISPASDINTWVYWVLTRHGGTLTLYRNGVQIGQRADLPATATANVNGYIGDQANGAYHLTGRIDDVAIYASALTASTVASHYQAALHGPAPG